MWFIEPSFKSKIETVLSKELPSATNLSAEISLLVQNQVTTFSDGGGTAVIAINGVLTQYANIFYLIFGMGNTTYSDISEALLQASNDESITQIRLEIDSPGGESSGLFDLLNVMGSVSKPITAIVGNMAASAAYAIASMADTIIASNRASSVGSIGAAATITVSDTEVDIASSNAPKKRPDVTTEAGKDIVREHLDAVEALFIEAVAEGRNTTINNVSKNFGRGAVVLADEALKLGMIDSIAKTLTATDAIVGKCGDNINMGVSNMDSKENEQHVDGYAEGLSCGVAQERDRVLAHLTLGEASGDMLTATTAIKEGLAVTAEQEAIHVAARIKQNTVAARADDNVDAVVAAATTEAQDKASQVLDQMEALNV